VVGEEGGLSFLIMIADSGDPDLLWRLARICIAIGEVAEGERRENK